MKPLVLAALFVLALATAVPAHAQTAPAPAPATGISTPSGAEIAKLEADVVRLGGKPVRWGYPASEVCGYEDYRSYGACKELVEATARLQAARKAAAGQ